MHDRLQGHVTRSGGLDTAGYVVAQFTCKHAGDLQRLPGWWMAARSAQMSRLYAYDIRSCLAICLVRYYVTTWLAKRAARTTGHGNTFLGHGTSVSGVRELRSAAAVKRETVKPPPHRSLIGRYLSRGGCPQRISPRQCTTHSAHPAHIWPRWAQHIPPATGGPRVLEHLSLPPGAPAWPKKVIFRISLRSGLLSYIT